MDSDRCWQHVEEMLKVMDHAFKFLGTGQNLDEIYVDPNIDDDEAKLRKEIAELQKAEVDIRSKRKTNRTLLRKTSEVM